MFSTFDRFLSRNNIAVQICSSFGNEESNCNQRHSNENYRVKLEHEYECKLNSLRNYYKNKCARLEKVRLSVFKY